MPRIILFHLEFDQENIEVEKDNAAVTVPIPEADGGFENEINDNCGPIYDQSGPFPSFQYSPGNEEQAWVNFKSPESGYPKAGELRKYKDSIRTLLAGEHLISLKSKIL